MDAEARRNYRAALKHAQAELAAHEKRGEALRATVEGLRNLLAVKAPAAAARKPAAKPKRQRRRRKSQGAGHPEVPAGTFKGTGPTAAYRKFIEMYGDQYTAPQIRDALIQGGVKTTSPTSLLTGIHSVRRRDRLKAEAQKQAETAG